jgi:hypothetical protein
MVGVSLSVKVNNLQVRGPQFDPQHHKKIIFWKGGQLSSIWGKSVVFSVCPNMCNYHLYLILEKLDSPQKETHTHQQSFPIPAPPPRLKQPPIHLISL